MKEKDHLEYIVLNGQVIKKGHKKYDEGKMHSIGRFLKRIFGFHRMPHISWAATLKSPSQSGTFPMN